MKAKHTFHKKNPVLSRSLNQSFHRFRINTHRFLNQNMFSSIYSIERVLQVKDVWCADVDYIDRWVGVDFAV
jgi:hypothetical protein